MAFVSLATLINNYPGLSNLLEHLFYNSKHIIHKNEYYFYENDSEKLFFQI